MVGHGHLAVGDGPVGIVVVVAQHLSVVFGTGHAGATPVFAIDEVGSLEGAHLVVLHTGIAHKLGVEFVAFGMSDHEINVGGVHPLGKGVGYGLRECFGVWSPREHHLGTTVGCALNRLSAKEGVRLDVGLVLILLDGDEVGKSLKGMHGGTLHEEHRTAAVLDELLEYLLFVVVLAALEAGEGAHTDDVAVAAHHGNSLQKVFALVALHDDSTLGLQFPRPLVHIEHDDVHAEVEGCLLGGEAGAQRVVEEDEHGGLVLAKCLILIAVGLDFESLVEGFAEVANVGNVLKDVHC